jgi:hypothetical protein
MAYIIGGIVLGVLGLALALRERPTKPGIHPGQKVRVGR